MKIHHWLISLCLLPLVCDAVDVAPKPATGTRAAPLARAAAQMPNVAVQFAMDGLPAGVESLKSLVTEANTTCI